MTAKESTNEVKSQTGEQGASHLFPWQGLIYFVILVLGLGVSYAPVFEQTPKRDQLYYLLEVSRSESLGEILAKSISYNRTRTVEASDVQLFRPGLFLLLGLQSYFFDYHFEYWRIVSLCLHLGVCLLLFRVLSGAQSPPSVAGGLRFHLAAAGTLLFAFSASVADVVSWEHIQGYLVFSGLILAAFRLGIAIEQDGMTTGRLVGLWAVLLVAVFFHEVATLFAPIFAAFVFAKSWQRQERVRAFWLFGAFVAIAGLYAAVSIWDYSLHAANLIREDFDQDLRAGSTLGRTAWHFVRYVYFCAVQPLFPFSVQWEYLQDQGVYMVDRFSASRFQILPRIVSFAVLCLIVGFIGWVTWKELRKGRFVQLLMVAVFGTYVLLYVLLRMNVRSDLHPNFLGVNSQYVYFCLPAFLCLLVPSCLIAVGGLSRAKANRRLKILTAYFAVAAAYGVWQTWQVNRAAMPIYERSVQEIWKPGKSALDAVLATGASRVAFLYENPLMRTAHSRLGAPLATIFFGRHEAREEEPEAYIEFPSGKITWPNEKNRSELKEAEAQFPQYAKTRTFAVISVHDGRGVNEFRASYVFYRARHEWLAYLSVYPCFEPKLAKRLPFAVVGKSLGEVEKSAQQGAVAALEAARTRQLLVGEFGTPLAVEIYRGYVLLQGFGRYFGMPGTVKRGKEMSALFDEENPDCIVADSIPDLRVLIDRRLDRQPSS